MNQQPLPNLPIYKPASTRIPPSTSEIVSLGLEYCFLTCAILLFFQGMTPRWDKLINDLSINFLAIMLEALPFMLICSLVSGLIEVFVPIAWIDRIFHQRKTMAVFLAGSMGLFLSY